MTTIYSELDVKTLKGLLEVIDTSNTSQNAAVIIKFGATWCGPCQNIKSTVNENFKQLSNNFMLFDLDVDDNLELYMALKKVKMVPSIPTLLCYCKVEERSPTSWFAPQISYVGSDINQVNNFFAQIKKICG